MRIDVWIKRIEDKVHTTRCEPIGESAVAKDFHINTDLLSSPPLNASDVLVLSMSSDPFADGEVSVKLPPIPFFEEFPELVRYQHTGKRHPRSRRKPRPARNTSKLGITLCYLIKKILGREFVTGRGPVYFGLSPATEAVTGDRTPSLIEDSDAADEAIRAAALAALDDFIRARIRPQRGARLTSWDVLDEFRGQDLPEHVINKIQLADIAPRVRGIFGITMEKTGTRIKGRHQRYWLGYTI